MARSKVDQLYRRLLLAKFFVKGWGKPENLHRIFSFRKKMADKNLCYSLVDPHTPVTITKKEMKRSYVLYEGHFKSPFEHHLPGLLPESSQKAYFQMILPHRWAQEDYRPVCIQLAGTGDHGFWKRRTLMAKPLVQDYGIGSILLENPFYGLRKPPEQRRSSLLNVSDLFVMGGCLVMESMVLMHWCLRQRLGPVGLTGISMGGHMASLACCSWPRPVPLVPCLSWTTASGVFTQGVLSGAINWELLTDQYFSNQAFRDELFNLIHSPEGHFSIYHEVGQNFARTYPSENGSLPNVKSQTNRDEATSTASKDLRSCGNMNEAANGNMSEAANGNMNEAANGNMSEAAKGNMNEAVNGNMSEAANGNMSEAANGNMNEATMKSDVGKNGHHAQESVDTKDCGSEVRRSDSAFSFGPENDSVKGPCSPVSEYIYSTSGSVNTSSNNKTGEASRASPSKGSSVNDRSDNSGFSHLDAQSNDLNAFNFSTKKLPDNAQLNSLDIHGNYSSERSVDYSSFSMSHTYVEGNSGLGSSSSSAISGNTSAGSGNVMTASTSMNKSSMFASTKPSSEKFSRGLLTTLNPLNIIRSNFRRTNSASIDANSASEDTNSISQDAYSTSKDANSTSKDANSISQDSYSTSKDAYSAFHDGNSAHKDANSASQDAHSASQTTHSEGSSSIATSSPDKQKPLQLATESHSKHRLDLLLGRYLIESTQKIISSSSSLFSRESGKSALKDDPHLGFTPVGIRPARSEHQNMVSFKPYFTVKDPLTWEAVQFMRGIMDECTHVANFGYPTDPELIIIIQATKDAYEPSDTMTPLDKVWRGAELRTVNAGHIEAFVLHHQLFREAVRDAFIKAYERYRLTEDWTQGGKPCIPPEQL